jgi:hypothetical protein
MTRSWLVTYLGPELPRFRSWWRRNLDPQMFPAYDGQGACVARNAFLDPDCPGGKESRVPRLQFYDLWDVVSREGIQP